jgi:hypothetical protein
MQRKILIAAALTLCVCGCASILPSHSDTPSRPAADANDNRDTAAALLIADSIQTLQRLSQGTPTEQAEILANARQAYERTPYGAAQLRYALVLATPGHAGQDVNLADKLLQEAAAQPDALVPAERALALLEIAQLEREIELNGQILRLQGMVARSADRDRLASLQKHLQAELDENARLRKQLEEDQAKLDAVADIERHVAERNPSNQGHTP